MDYSPQTLYRLPWNLVDNSISWLEPTSKCNLYCDGCYRENRNDSHKSLKVVQEELDIFEKYRKTDGVSIAGGEPLMHPNIVEIVKMVRAKGWKPIINTNGALLTKELLIKLKKAGCDGFTFHIDSGQQRAGWKDKNELELNELRLQLAELVDSVGGFSCSFNATIYPETLKYVPELLKWSQDHIDKVHVIVFILYRMANIGHDIEYYVKDQKVEFDAMTYSTDDENRRKDIQAPEVVDLIRQTEPEFMPSAFLNGTVKLDSYKWLMSLRLGNKHKIFGYSGPKYMEIIQAFNHLFTGKYLAYGDPKFIKRGRLTFLLAPFDKGIREIMKNYFKSFTTDVKAFFSRVHQQSVLIIQPIDFMPSGELNMCDGCPDMTIYNGELVWSCRMEEQVKWGQNVRYVQKKKNEEEKT